MSILALSYVGELSPWATSTTDTASEVLALVFSNKKECLTTDIPVHVLIGMFVDHGEKNYNEFLFADFLVRTSDHVVFERTPGGFATQRPQTLPKYVEFSTSQKFAIPCLDLTREREVLKLNLSESLESVFSQNAFISGTFATQLEAKIEQRVGRGESASARKCVTVANGTDALEIAYRTVSEKSTVPQKDQVVLVPSFTFIATASAAKLAGLKVEFLDCAAEKGKYIVEASEVAARLHRDVVAVVGVSLFGQIPDWAEYRSVINAFDPKICLIEDAAQSFGCRGSLTSLTDFSCTSFYPAKLLGGCGDGGAILCKEADHNLVRSLANHGTGVMRYTHDRIGRNSRLDGIQAAILLQKLDKLDLLLHSRRQIGKVYAHFLKPIAGLSLPLPSDVPSQFTIELTPRRRDGLLAFLKDQKVDARIFYPIPCHQQHPLRQKSSFPNTTRKCKQVLSLPAFPFMSKTEILFVVSCIKRYFSKTSPHTSRV